MAQPIRIKDKNEPFYNILFYTIRASFTNSLPQRKPSLALKQYGQDLLRREVKN